MHRIQGLAAQEASSGASGSSPTSSGTSGAVENPIHVQMAGLGVQLASLQDDDSNPSRAHREAVNGGPHKKGYASAAKNQVRHWAFLGQNYALIDSE